MNVDINLNTITITYSGPVFGKTDEYGDLVIRFGGCEIVRKSATREQYEEWCDAEYEAEERVAEWGAEWLKELLSIPKSETKTEDVGAVPS